MQVEEIKQILESALDLDEIQVTGDGSHFQIIAVGALFEGVSRVKQQQLIYAPLAEHIASNALHALSIKAFTPEKWQREKSLNVLGQG